MRAILWKSVVQNGKSESTLWRCLPGTRGDPFMGRGVKKAVSTLKPLLAGCWESQWGWFPSFFWEPFDIGSFFLLNFRVNLVCFYKIYSAYVGFFFTFSWFHCSVFLFTLFPLKLISWEWKNVVFLVGSERFVLMSWNPCWCCLFQSTLLLECWFIHSMVNECLSSLQIKTK